MSQKSRRNRHSGVATSRTAAPEFIYKYSSINQYFLESLRRSSFWFSHHEKLNDPFDCQLQFSDSFFEHYGYLRNHHDLLRKAAQEGFLWGVCCFTLDPSNRLMWGHYGDGHKGVCLEFQTRRLEMFSNRIRPVIYSDETRVIERWEEFVPKGFLQKTTHWAYEKEWRLLAGGDMYMPYPRAALSAVIFGAKASIASVKEVLTVCKAGFRRARFYRMRIDASNSTMTRVPMPR